MKISTNEAELKKLNACKSSYDVFVEAHGDDDALLSECLTSNGWDDVWWLISAAYGDFSEQQKKELHLLGCDWAESCLINFESVYPNDKRPRQVIQAKRDYLEGIMTLDGLEAVKSAEWSAELAAESAARSAARSAESARSAELAAELAAESAQQQDLMELFLKWESGKCTKAN